LYRLLLKSTAMSKTARAFHNCLIGFNQAALISYLKTSREASYFDFLEAGKGNIETFSFRPSTVVWKMDMPWRPSTESTKNLGANGKVRTRIRLETPRKGPELNWEELFPP
jgi:hypothetical protein